MKKGAVATEILISPYSVCFWNAQNISLIITYIFTSNMYLNMIWFMCCSKLKLHQFKILGKIMLVILFIKIKIIVLTEVKINMFSSRSQDTLSMGTKFPPKSKCSINMQRIDVYPKNRDNWYTCVSLVNLFHIMWLKYTKNKGSEIQCCVVYLHILHYPCQTRFPEYYVFTVFGFGSLLLIKSFRIRITMLSCFWLHPWTANIILSINPEPHTSVNL